MILSKTLTEAKEDMGELWDGSVDQYADPSYGVWKTWESYGMAV